MSSYREERLAAMDANRRLIRSRSAEMERNVAKFLSGRRVPMSGAGYLKGDCEIVTDKVGRILIECKYSAHRDKTRGPNIRIDFKWLDKMERDAAAMKAVFPALVFRFHDVRLSNHVIIRTDVLKTYDTEDRISGAAYIDAGDRSGITLYKSMLDTAIAAHAFGHPVALLTCNRGEYAVITLALFKEIIHGTEKFDTL